MELQHGTNAPEVAMQEMTGGVGAGRRLTVSRKTEELGSSLCSQYRKPDQNGALRMIPKGLFSRELSVPKSCLRIFLFIAS